MSELPAFMRDNLHAGKEVSMWDNPRSWIERARWIGQYHEEPDRLLLVMQAVDIAEAHPCEVRALTEECYPLTELELADDERLNNFNNRDVCPKSLYLTAIFVNLSSHAGVPATAINDHLKLSRKYRLRGSQHRARAQAVLLANHKADNKEIARQSGMSKPNVCKDLRSGRLARPTYDLQLEMGELISIASTCSSPPASVVG